MVSKTHSKTIPKARLVAQDIESQRVLEANAMCGGTIRMDSQAEFVYKLENMS